MTGDDVTLETERERLSLYLRALWNREYRLLPCERPASQLRPYLSERGLHLPAQFAAVRGALLREVYRAAAAHAAAHAVYATQRFARGALKPIQLAIIGVLEDARIEHCAIAAMPGLRRLWLQFFDGRSHQATSAEALLLRLSHALLDPARLDDNPWVIKARERYAAWQSAGGDADGLRAIGVLLGNDLGQMRVQFNAKSYLPEPLYRDDNLFLWESEAPPEETRTQDEGARENAEAALSRWRGDQQASEVERFRAREVADGANDDSSGAPDTVLRYPEWDSRLGRYRPQWCSIIETSPVGSSEQHVTTTDPGIAQRLAQALRANQRGRLQRLGRQTDGEAIDLDALIAVHTARRCGELPALRVYQRRWLQRPDLSVLLLLDLSASTNALVGGATLLSRLTEAAVALTEAVLRNGDQIAVHGFRSNGRHEVQYLRYKAFDEPLTAQVRAQLASAQGALSTRLGAAIRHASRQLYDRRATHRLIMVLTDGEPHDIDVFHPTLLLEDAARAVAQSAAVGIPVFAVSVDARADTYLRRIFGEHHYDIVDAIAQLPDRLPRLYRQLAA